MKRTGATATIAILAGILISTRCHHPPPPAVETVPGAFADADRKIRKELVAAFDRAEQSDQRTDLETLMQLYCQGLRIPRLEEARRLARLEIARVLQAEWV